MKNKIKEIIAERIKYHSNKEKYGYFIVNSCVDICASDILEDVKKAGYRKQSDTVKEFATKVNDYLKHSIFRTKGEDCKESVYKIIDKLAEEYGKED